MNSSFCLPWACRLAAAMVELPPASARNRTTFFARVWPATDSGVSRVSRRRTGRVLRMAEQYSGALWQLAMDILRVDNGLIGGLSWLSPQPGRSAPIPPATAPWTRGPSTAATTAGRRPATRRRATVRTPAARASDALPQVRRPSGQRPAARHAHDERARDDVLPGLALFVLEDAEAADAERPEREDRREAAHEGVGELDGAAVHLHQTRLQDDASERRALPRPEDDVV